MISIKTVANFILNYKYHKSGILFMPLNWCMMVMLPWWPCGVCVYSTSAFNSDEHVFNCLFRKVYSRHVNFCIIYPF